MKWGTLIFVSVVALLLLSSGAFAKDVTVVFDYPSGTDFSSTVTVPDDANAYTAITQAADAASIQLDLVYYDGLGYFVNGIGGTEAPAGTYWAFFINNVYSTTDGMSAYIPENNDSVGFSAVDFSFSPVDYNFYVHDSLGNPLSAQLFLDNSVHSLGSTNSSGLASKQLGITSGEHTFIAKDGGTSESVSVAIDGTAKTVEITFPDAISVSLQQSAIAWLLSTQHSSGEFDTGAVWGNSFALMGLSLFDQNASAKQDAINYVLANQQSDGGFAYPGFSSDALHTAVATVALTANGHSLHEFDKNGFSAIDYLATTQESDGGFSGWGAGDVDTTSWAMLAYAATGTQLPEKNSHNPVDFLLSAQNEDGGFPYTQGQSSAVDYTSEALLALAAQGHAKDSSITAAIDYLIAQENSQGCFSNVYYNSLAALAFNAYDENSEGLVVCIKDEQKSNGGFGRSANSTPTDTGLALMALEGKTLPLTVSDTNNGFDSNTNIIALYKTVKFTVKITNSGKVSATNVFVDLNGIPDGWIKDDVSTRTFSEIKPKETKTATIYVEMQGTGNYAVNARVSSATTIESIISNFVSFGVFAADLSAELSMAS